MPVKVTKAPTVPKKPEPKFPRLRQFNLSGSVFLEVSENSGFYLTNRGGHTSIGDLITDDPSAHIPFEGQLILENN